MSKRQYRDINRYVSLYNVHNGRRAPNCFPSAASPDISIPIVAIIDDSATANAQYCPCCGQSL